MLTVYYLSMPDQTKYFKSQILPDNGNVHRAAANIIVSKSRAARGSVCNVLLSRGCAVCLCGIYSVDCKLEQAGVATAWSESHIVPTKMLIVSQCWPVINRYRKSHELHI